MSANEVVSVMLCCKETARLSSLTKTCLLLFRSTQFAMCLRVDVMLHQERQAAEVLFATAILGCNSCRCLQAAVHTKSGRASLCATKARKRHPPAERTMMTGM